MDEAYKFMRSVQDNVKPKDDFAVYGENVASRMRGAKQDSRAISIAKNRIDNILFQLEMGELVVREVVMNNPASSVNTYYPVPYYPIEASPTPSSASMPLSSPSPSPSATSSQRSLHTLQPQYQSGPQPYNSGYRAEIPWQQHSYNMPENQRPSQMSLPQQNFNLAETQQTQPPSSLPQQHIDTTESRSPLVMTDLHEFLAPKENSHSQNS